MAEITFFSWRRDARVFFLLSFCPTRRKEKGTMLVKKGKAGSEIDKKRKNVRESAPYEGGKNFIGR